MQSRSRSKTRKSGQRADNRAIGTAALPKEFALANSATRIFTKRIVTEVTLSANGAGLIPATTLASTNSVSVLGDFSSVAAIYSNYRVKAIRLTCNPYYPVPAWTGAAFITVSPLIVVVPFRSGLVPSTYVGFSESSEAKYASGYKGGVFTTTNKGYPDGHLWHPTNAVITSADSYGLAAMGQNLIAGTASVPVWAVNVEYLVEFSVEN